MPRKLTRILSFFLCILLVFQQSGFAQVAGQLDISGYFAGLRASFTPEKFRPLHLRYLSYDGLNNNFKLLLDKGDIKSLNKEEVEDTTKTLLKYFFIGISLPNESFWVNLRPDSPDNIIDADLARTKVGKILLEADLQLKKETAKFTSPQTSEGTEYWSKLYQKAEELFGTSNITIPTLTRPWIVPDEIIIRESQDNAYIYKATLKVMLEQDYLKDSTVYNFKDQRSKELNDYSSQLIRELIIPKLTKEINTAKRYAPLRQVYYSLILAQWFKDRFYGKSGLYAWLIDQKNLNGLTSRRRWSKATYFKAYQKSFKDGEYNIKTPISTSYGQTIRSYFSGGIAFGNLGLPPVPAGVGGVSQSRPGAIAQTTRIEAPPKKLPVGSGSILGAEVSMNGANSNNPYAGIRVTAQAIEKQSIVYSPRSTEEGTASSGVGKKRQGLSRREFLQLSAGGTALLAIESSLLASIVQAGVYTTTDEFIKQLPSLWSVAVNRLYKADMSREGYINTYNRVLELYKNKIREVVGSDKDLANMVSKLFGALRLDAQGRHNVPEIEKALTELNSHLINDKLYLFIEPRVVNVPHGISIFHMFSFGVVEETDIVFADQNAAVKFLKQIDTSKDAPRYYPLGVHFGSESFCVVFLEKIEREADNAFDIVNYSDPLLIDLMEQLSPGKFKLLKKEFSGATKNQIREAIKNLVAIHEGRHLLNKNIKASNQIADETLAYLAAMVFSGNPYFVLAQLGSEILSSDLVKRTAALNILNSLAGEAGRSAASFKKIGLLNASNYQGPARAEDEKLSVLLTGLSELSREQLKVLAGKIYSQKVKEFLASSSSITLGSSVSAASSAIKKIESSEGAINQIDGELVRILQDSEQAHLRDLYKYIKALQEKIPKGKKLKILCVCTGNYNRSPAMEKVIRFFLQKLGREDIEVASVGISGDMVGRTSRDLEEAADSIGIQTEAVIARQVTKSDVEEADLIIVATRDHGAILGRRFRDDIEDIDNRVFELGEFYEDLPIDKSTEVKKNLEMALSPRDFQAIKFEHLRDYLPDPARGQISDHGMLLLIKEIVVKGVLPLLLAARGNRSPPSSEIQSKPIQVISNPYSDSARQQPITLGQKDSCMLALRERQPIELQMKGEKIGFGLSGGVLYFQRLGGSRRNRRDGEFGRYYISSLKLDVNIGLLDGELIIENNLEDPLGITITVSSGLGEQQKSSLHMKPEITIESLRAMPQGKIFEERLRTIGLDLANLFTRYNDTFDVYVLDDNVMGVLEHGDAFNWAGRIFIGEATLQGLIKGDDLARHNLVHERAHVAYNAVHGYVDRSNSQALVSELYSYFKAFIEVYGSHNLFKPITWGFGKGKIVTKDDYPNALYSVLIEEYLSEVHDLKERQDLSMRLKGAIASAGYLFQSVFSNSMILEYIKSCDSLDQLLGLLHPEHLKELSQGRITADQVLDYNKGEERFLAFKDAYKEREGFASSAVGDADSLDKAKKQIIGLIKDAIARFHDIARDSKNAQLNLLAPRLMLHEVPKYEQVILGAKSEDLKVRAAEIVSSIRALLVEAGIMNQTGGVIDENLEEVEKAIALVSISAKADKLMEEMVEFKKEDAPRIVDKTLKAAVEELKKEHPGKDKAVSKAVTAIKKEGILELYAGNIADGSIENGEELKDGLKGTIRGFAGLPEPEDDSASSGLGEETLWTELEGQLSQIVNDGDLAKRLLDKVDLLYPTYQDFFTEEALIKGSLFVKALYDTLYSPEATKDEMSYILTHYNKIEVSQALRNHWRKRYDAAREELGILADRFVRDYYHMAGLWGNHIDRLDYAEIVQATEELMATRDKYRTFFEKYKIDEEAASSAAQESNSKIKEASSVTGIEDMKLPIATEDLGADIVGWYIPEGAEYDTKKSWTEEKRPDGEEHDGVDLAFSVVQMPDKSQYKVKRVQPGTPVRAVSDGIVKYVHEGWKHYSDIEIEHTEDLTPSPGQRFYSKYGHVAAREGLDYGDKVEEGEIIGYLYEGKRQDDRYILPPNLHFTYGQITYTEAWPGGPIVYKQQPLDPTKYIDSLSKLIIRDIHPEINMVSLDDEFGPFPSTGSLVSLGSASRAKEPSASSGVGGEKLQAAGDRLQAKGESASSGVGEEGKADVEFRMELKDKLLAAKHNLSKGETFTGVEEDELLRLAGLAFFVPYSGFRDLAIDVYDSLGRLDEADKVKRTGGPVTPFDSIRIRRHFDSDHHSFAGALTRYCREYVLNKGYPEEFSFHSLTQASIIALDLKGEHDIGVGIAKGGMSYSLMFSLMGLPTVLAEAHTRYGRDEFKWLDEVDASMFKDKRVIIFEDTIGEGNTLKKVMREIKKYGPKQIDILFSLPRFSNYKEAIPWQDLTNVYYAEDFEKSELLIPTLREVQGRLAAYFESGNASAGSSVVMEPAKGGIDLRALPIVSEAASWDSPLRSSSNRLSLGDSPKQGIAVPASLRKEWRQIENMIQSGIIPSGERIKEYLESCYAEGCVGSEINKVLSCIADIFRLEEERAIPTEPGLKEFLVLLESDKSEEEFKLALSGIEFAAGEPKTIEE